MVEVNHRLPCRRAEGVSLLALLRGKAMKAKEIAVFCEDDMLFVLIAKDLAELLEIFCAADVLSEVLLLGFGDGGTADEVEEVAGTVVEPLDDGPGEERDNEGEDGLEKEEQTAEDEGGVVPHAETAEKGETGHGGLCSTLHPVLRVLIADKSRDRL